MATVDVTGRAHQLTAARRPFVHATVVRAQEPTSARAGDAAVILDDGSIEGFVGGTCAESSVRTAALGLLEDGRTLLLRVLPDGGTAFPETPGARVVINPCHSGGAIEIFLRPVLPPPVLRVAGATPIGDAVATLAASLGFLIDRMPGRDEAATAVIVAGLGRAEEATIRAALEAGVDFIGLVASPRRGALLLDGMGLTTGERARVRTPVGLWIGARTPSEIAVSIMAEVVRAIRLEGLRPARPVTGERPRQVIDPVCGMTVLIGPDTPHTILSGQDDWFCGAGCLQTFTRRADRTADGP